MNQYRQSATEHTRPDHSDGSGGAAATNDRHQPMANEGSVTETLQAIVMAFILAFIFRAYVVEPFVIPTGSMAPTLRGQHLLARGPMTGYAFAVSPRDKTEDGYFAPTQGERRPIVARDPMLAGQSANATSTAGPEDDRDVESADSATGASANLSPDVVFNGARVRMGDRILVLKYLYALRPPRRYDVVVFKYPVDPSLNFIKRLIGLPGETIWLADGDVFVSESGRAGPFSIRRKPLDVQRRIWRPVYHSDFVPPEPGDFRPEWHAPWSGDGWEIGAARSYRLNSAAASTLIWNQDLVPITDHTVYNDTTPDNGGTAEFPLADIRLAAHVEPKNPMLRWSIRLDANGHAFDCRFDPEAGNVTLRMKRTAEFEHATLYKHLGPLDEWRTLASTDEFPTIPMVRGANVEFWHVDQSLALWIDGELILRAEYDWEPRLRLKLATGLAPDEAREIEDETNPYTNYAWRPSPARLAWTFENGPVTLRRVELDRDIYYQPTTRGGFDEPVTPGFATHPDSLPTLSFDEYFVLGDNSGASSDARVWERPAPWVATRIDERRGVVHRDLIIGQAFFVYFPSPEGLPGNRRRFLPNFGEMRFIH